MHATGQIRSDRERAIITTGYGPTMFPYWDDQAADLSQDAWRLSDGFRARIPEGYRTLFLGRRSWSKPAKYREGLTRPVDAGLAGYDLGAWERALAAGGDGGAKL